MTKYTFKIGVKTFECIAPSIESAYKSAENFKAHFNWKGQIILITKN
jgi:hypothetical protein